jgi:hypothetical protein
MCVRSTDMESCDQWRDWASEGLAPLLCYTFVAVVLASYSAWIATLFPCATLSSTQHTQQ